ncbi:DUF523 domain-containing protein [Marinilabiliaceae bacterium JC017]|nr:DUF523 domain-containing protein [Marinilabiliaceae bacterium JC017]
MSKLILVSACLAGVNCRYNGGNSKIEEIAQLVNSGKAIPVCPEVLGGLETPRACSEIILDQEGLKVMSNQGEDLTHAFKEGARKTLEVVKALDINTAILQSRSPSCGFGKIYDGTFTGKMKKGNGFTAELLSQHGIEIYTDENFGEERNKEIEVRE